MDNKLLKDPLTELEPHSFPIKTNTCQYGSIVFGISTILIGLVVIIGWWSKLNILVQLSPTGVPMKFNTAICLILGGLGLLSYCQKKILLRNSLILFFGTLLIFISGFTLSQDIFVINFGIDELFSADWTTEIFPGRMSQSTSTSIIMLGFLFVLLPFEKYTFSIFWIMLISLFLLIIGIFALSGYIFNLHALYDWSNFRPMALPTCLGILFLNVGLWLSWRQEEWTSKFFYGRNDIRVIILGDIIILIVASLSIFYGFSVLAEKQTENTKTFLNVEMDSKITAFLDDINEIDASVKIIKNILSSQDFEKNTNDHQLVEYIRYILLGSGSDQYSWISPDNRAILTSNVDEHNAELTVPLSKERSLIWKNGYIIRYHLTLIYNNKNLGTLTAEWYLNRFNKEISEVEKFGKTGEIFLCTLQAKETAVCFPSRFNKHPFTIELIQNQTKIPMYYALHQQDGFIVAKDYKGHQVLASFGQLNNFNLGIVVKQNIAEIYKPTQNEIIKFITALIVFLCIGAYLLYLYANPLVKGIVLSERKARKSKHLAQKINIKLKRTLKSLIKSNAEASELTEMFSFLQTCENTADSLEVCSKYCKKIFPNANGAIYLMTNDKTELKLGVTWGDVLNKPEYLSLGSCWAIQNDRIYTTFKPGEELICNHVTQDIQSLYGYCCSPLRGHGETIGLIYFEFPQQESHTSPMKIPELKRLIAHLSDGIGLALSNIQLRQNLIDQSIHDPLTELYNRRFLDETFKKTIGLATRKNLSIAILMIDIDFFKKYNDTYGHEAGDIILKNIGKYLRENIREYNIASRFGGEEFVVVLLDISLEDALKRAEAIRSNIEKMELTYQGQFLPAIHISIGVSFFPENGKDPDTLINAADKALYMAKEQGRNRVMVFKP